MSKFKDQTGNTPQSSSGENTEVLERPSSPSARTDNTQTFTKSTSQPLPPTMPEGITTPDNSLTTVRHALVLKAALSYLLKIGMVKRFKVLSPDGVIVLKIRYEFDMSQWTEGLEPK